MNTHCPSRVVFGVWLRTRIIGHEACRGIRKRSMLLNRSWRFLRLARCEFRNPLRLTCIGESKLTFKPFPNRALLVVKSRKYCADVPDRAQDAEHNYCGMNLKPKGSYSQILNHFVCIENFLNLPIARRNIYSAAKSSRAIEMPVEPFNVRERQASTEVSDVYESYAEWKAMNGKLERSHYAYQCGAESNQKLCDFQSLNLRVATMSYLLLIHLEQYLFPHLLRPRFFVLSSFRHHRTVLSRHVGRDVPSLERSSLSFDCWPPCAWQGRCAVAANSFHPFSLRCKVAPANSCCGRASPCRLAHANNLLKERDHA